ncbi:MAG TPA: branched-chain amino acid ABC transporter permease [Castellaniella sp.]|uniref:branched-chain amino acid ABC transporter permease n=1 Tax=Castellaniella sp. TaxID=1955812 RepID=UPI002F244453
MDLLIQILISSFVIGAIYALGAAGMAAIFGISGVLNLAHGALVVLGAMVAWYVAQHTGLGVYLSALTGVLAAIVATYLLYALVILPLERFRHIPPEEKHVFQLVATLLVAIIIQGVLEWTFGATPVTTPPMLHGVVQIGGNTVPRNSLLIGGVAWFVLIALWLFISRTRMGKAMLAASMSPKGLAIVGYDIRRVHVAIWGLYGLVVGVAGVLLASFTSASGEVATNITAISFTIVVLGGLGNILGSLVGAYILGVLSTLTAFLISPAISELPGLVLLVLVLYVRPQGLFGRR